MKANNLFPEIAKFSLLPSYLIQFVTYGNAGLNKIMYSTCLEVGFIRTCIISSKLVLMSAKDHAYLCSHQIRVLLEFGGCRFFYFFLLAHIFRVNIFVSFSTAPSHFRFVMIFCFSILTAKIFQISFFIIINRCRSILTRWEERGRGCCWYFESPISLKIKSTNELNPS